MSPDSSNSESRRVADEITARLRSRGVQVNRRDTPEDLVRLLEAVEEFERTVERQGGDLMVDEGIGSARATEPDSSAFVLPARQENEDVGEYVARIAAARGRAARSRLAP